MLQYEKIDVSEGIDTKKNKFIKRMHALSFLVF